MPNIFDLITADEIATYWETLNQGQPPYLFETLFPAEKQLGLKLSYIKGANGLPVVLNTSAFDAKAIPRGRIGFDKLELEMPYFKEAMYIDEALRQRLNEVNDTSNQAIKDVILNRIFADESQLLASARVSRERICAMIVTSGTAVFGNNGQEYSYDYGVPSSHKITEQSFGTADFDIAAFINRILDTVENDTGVRPTRGICSRSVMDQILTNTTLAKSVYVLTNGVGTINQQTAIDYIRTQTGVTLQVYTKRYKDETGAAVPYIPDHILSLIPDGNLGRMWFGTTPEESDLMSGNTTNVRITDTGVAVATTREFDPVQVLTKVSQICMPSFETADQIAIIDTTPKPQSNG